MTVPNLNDPAVLAFLQQLQAQQQAPAQAAPTVAAGIPVQQAAPPVPTVPVSVSDAVADAERPKGYGPSLWTKATRIPGTVVPFTVAGKTGAKQAENYKTKLPESYRDGRPKIELVIPLDVPATPNFPEGRATLYSKGSLTTLINTAMTRAGVPDDVRSQGLEVGATGSITFVAKVEREGKDGDSYSENVFEVTYNRPSSTPTPTPVVQAPPVQVPVPAPQPAAPVLPAVPGAQDPAAILAALVAAQKPAA